MRLVWIIVGLVGLLTSPVVAATSSDIDVMIARYAAEHQFNGTILVEEQGRRLHAASYGVADRAFGIPAASDHRYRLASVTKLFTSVLVLQLVDQSKIDLAAPIATYLPDYPGGGADRVTVRQLLNHSSGLAPFDRVESYQQGFSQGMPQYQQPMSLAQLLTFCCSGPLVATPGAAFAYNNADYIVLAAMIEKVTGRSYEAVLRERILAPLALADSGIAYSQPIIARLVPTYFYRDDSKTLVRDMPVYAENWHAAGAMYSSADDLARFADALFGGKLLSPRGLDALLMPGHDDYGLGLWSYSIRRGGLAYHVAKRPGSIMGANAVLYRLRERDLTIILLANTNLTDLDVFAQRIANQFVGEPAPKK